MSTELTTFQYPDQMTGDRCEALAQDAEQIHAMHVHFTIKCRVEIGRILNQARELLGYGAFGEWLRWRFPDWSEEATRRWRVMAERVDRNPKLLDILNLFQSTAAAEEYAALPEPTQALVLKEEAFTWSKFHAVRWDAAMRERLADDELDHDRRCGDVLHAIEEATHDPALREVAETLYNENRDTFARLADREPAEVDVETGIKTKREPQGDAPSASLVEGDEGYWLCRWDGERFHEVAPVNVRLLMWNGSQQPAILAAFPDTLDGPVSKSWQSAVIDSACRRVNAKTLESRFGEVL